eukprot:6273368-Pyramimonas_sp.AAC.1
MPRPVRTDSPLGSVRTGPEPAGGGPRSSRRTRIGAEPCEGTSRGWGETWRRPQRFTAVGR